MPVAGALLILAPLCLAAISRLGSIVGQYGLVTLKMLFQVGNATVIVAVRVIMKPLGSLAAGALGAGPLPGFRVVRLSAF